MKFYDFKLAGSLQQEYHNSGVGVFDVSVGIKHNSNGKIQGTVIPLYRVTKDTINQLVNQEAVLAISLQGQENQLGGWTEVGYSLPGLDLE